MKDINQLLRLIYPFKKEVSLTLFFNILSIIFSLSSLGLAIPFLRILFKTQELVSTQLPWKFDMEVIQHNVGYYISHIVTTQGEYKALLVISALVIITSLLRNVFIYFANYFLAPARNGVVRNLRNKIYVKIVELPLSYFTEKRKGDIITRITSDIQEIEYAAINSILVLMRDPFRIIFYVGTLFVISVKLSLFVLVLLPLSGLLIGRLGKKIKNLGKIGQTYMANLVSNVEETLSGLRIIKAFNAENQTKNNFFKLNQEHFNVFTRLIRRRDLGAPISEFLGTIVMMIIMIYGGSLILDGKSNLGPEHFITYILIFSQVINPAKALSTAFYNVRKGAASLDRINEVINTENIIPENENAKGIASFENEILFNNVSFSYTDKPVLKNINLGIKKGKTIAIVGESGSGKSTLVDLIPRFYDIIEGSLTIDNTPINQLKIKDLRDLMGIVNQEPILFNNTIYNNIAFGDKQVSKEEVIEAAKVANAHEFILEKSEGYDTNIGDRGTKLSGGQRQRISIARAVLKNPPILILDEATSALDTESEKVVQDALNKLMKNRTSIIIAHRLSTVKDADEIIVLQEGKIIERGNHNELIALNGAYKRYHELQMF